MLSALKDLGIDFSVSQTDIEEWLGNADSTSYPALSQALRFLLRDTRLVRPVFLDAIVFNYEQGRGGSSPREIEEVDLDRLRGAVLQAYNTRYKLGETDFAAITGGGPAGQKELPTVFFGFGSAKLNAPAQAILEAAAEEYRRTGSTSIAAVGHADTAGPANYNQRLSEARARAVAEALVARGVAKSEITVAGRGESEPAVQTANGFAEPRNRRVVVSLGQPKDPTTGISDADHIVPSQEVGVLPGQSSVTSAGEYHYTLPIIVPKGRSGIQPELSLQYSSRGGDGRLGVGWALQGLPEIRRCGSTRATEGKTDGIHYDSGDRFSLDGQKLVAIKGLYGGHETEYRTEQNVFARIVSYVEDPLSPAEPSRFRVWTKDGRILDFGGPSRTSRILAVRARTTGRNGIVTAEGLRTVVWALQSMSDRAGNRMSVTHRQTIETRVGEGIEYFPEQISYVRQGNEDTRQERRITFEYDTRPDPSFQYSSGIRFNNTRRLREIIILVAAREMGRYRLDYRTSAKTGRSLLTSVRRCDGAGRCLSAKRFDWDTDVSVRPAWVSHEAPAPDILPLNSPFLWANRMIVADFNADGRDDVLYQVPTGTHNEERVRFSEGENLSPPKRFAAPFSGHDLAASRAVDIDNDGLAELMAFVTVRGHVGWHLLRPQGEAFVQTGTFVPPGSTTDAVTTNKVDFADVDGDGRLDLVHSARHRPRDLGQRLNSIALNTGSGFGLDRDAGPHCGLGLGGRVADINGDGRSEWIVGRCGTLIDGDLAAVGLTADGANILTDTTTMNIDTTELQQWVFIDINGDGLPDVLYTGVQFLAPGQPAWKVRWNTGHGFTGLTLIPAMQGFMLDADPPKLAFGEAFDSGIRVADFDGDGREDLAKFSSGIEGFPRELRVFYSRGEHFESKKIDVDPGNVTPLGWRTAQVGDFDGDGMPDLITAKVRTLRLADETTEEAPALATHNGRLVFGWKGHANDDLNILVADDPTEGFLHKLTIPDESDRSPALASHDGRLFMAWKGHDDHLNLIVSEDNGASFTGKRTFGDTTDEAPALASHNGRLYIAWRGSGNKDLNVASVALNAGPGGSFGIGEFEAKATLGDESTHAPALASHGGRLFLAWKGSGNEEINLAKVLLIGNTVGGFKIAGVEEKRIIPGETTDDAPALASDSSRLFVSWKGAENDDNLNIIVTNDGGATFVAKRIFGDASDRAPVLASHDGRLFMAWKGSDNENVNLARVTFFASNAGEFGIQDLEHLTARGGGPMPLRVLLNTNLKPDLMMAVEDERIDPEVRRASEIVRYLDDRSSSWGPTQHNPQIPCVYPQRSIKRGLPVVRALGRWNGTAFNWNRYTYADARLDLLGRGFLGFGEQVVVDEARSKTVTLRFDHHTREGTVYPFAGRAIAREEVVAGRGVERTTRSSTEYEVQRLDGGLTFAVNPRRTRTTVHEGLALPVLLRDDTLTQEFDNFGNETRRLSVTPGGISSESTTKMNAGGRFETDWLVNLPAETVTRVGQLDIANTKPRTVRYTWDNIGQLSSVVTEPDNPTLRFAVDYEYASGLVRRVTSSGASGSRAVTIGYDEDEVHPRRMTNALGHTSWTRIHAGLDVPLLTIDPNGIASRYSYDGFGRKRSERADDGRGADIDYALATTALGDTEMRVAVRGAPREVTEYDALGRPIFRRVEAFDGRWATTKLVYDELGRVTSETRPGYDTHPSPPSPHATKLTYDLLDRVTSITAPDNATVSIRYTGLESFTTDPVGNVVRTKSDPHGRIIERTETTGLLWKSFYRYGNFGVLDAVEHSFQPPVIVGYDGLGRMIKLQDPDAGTRTFAYDEFGDLKSETNALGQITRCRRDALGRVVEQIDAQGRSVFRWDEKPFAVGKPVRSRSPDGIVTDYGYDVNGRPSRTATVVDGVTFTTRNRYDDFGRLMSRQYPVLGKPFDLAFEYASTGYLRSVRGSNGDPFFTVEARAADGQLERSRAGNGLVSETEFDPRNERILAKRLLSATTPIFDLQYTYEPRGLVSTRVDHVLGISETFSYDAAERLIRYFWQGPQSGGPPATVTTDYGYDALSNLVTEQQNDAVTRTYEYSSPNRPRALTKMTTPQGVWTFAYDAGGRQIERRRSPGGGRQSRRTIRYTPFHLPSLVALNNGGPATRFKYAADRRRVLEADGRRSIVMIDGIYERRRENGSGPTSQVAYVPGEGGPAAQVEFDKNGQVKGVAYYQADAISSVQAVSRGDATMVDDRFFYEPFGMRISAQGHPLSDPADGSGPRDVRRGFTGHDHDDALGLIDMNGRGYDPLQRRFITPDPVGPYRDLTAALRTSVDATVPGSPSPGPIVELPAVGGIAVGSSDAGGFKPTTVENASSPSSAGATTPPGSMPWGSAVPSSDLAIAAQWELLHPYSYAQNSPLNYTDPSGFTPTRNPETGVITLDEITVYGTPPPAIYAEIPNQTFTVLGSPESSAGGVGSLESSVQVLPHTSEIVHAKEKLFLLGAQLAVGALTAGVTTAATAVEEAAVSVFSQEAAQGLELAAEAGTTLYRAVGPAELADIQATGVFRNLGSAEGKYFTTSAEAASSYAKQAVHGFGDAPYTLTQTPVPKSIFKGLSPATVDRGIPAWVIPNERLPGLIPQVLDTMPIPP